MPVTFDSLPTHVSAIDIKLNTATRKIDAANERLDAIEALLKQVLDQNPSTHLLSNYLTREQASQALNVSLVTLNAWVNEGKINVFHMGKKVFFKRADVMAVIQPYKRTRKKRGGAK